MKESFYSIRDLEILSGIKAHTIRIWEKRYQLLKPARTNANIRYYCDQELRKLLNIAQLIRHGNRISELSILDEEQLKDKVVSIHEDKLNNSDYIETLIMHMINVEDIQFNSLLNELIELLGIEKAFSSIFFPFLRRVGLFWQVGTIFPAQEHYVSNLFRQKLISEIDRLYDNQKIDKTILFYLHENESHELSLLYYALLSLKMGYRVLYLGQKVPLEDVKRICKKRKIDLIITSFINSINYEELKDYLKDLHKELKTAKIFVSGRQLSDYEIKLPENITLLKDLDDFKEYLLN